MKKLAIGMNRREFLRRAGVGSIALASATALGSALTRPASANGQTNFRFAAVSIAPPTGGVDHRMIMNGDGTIYASQAVGGGSFLHFNNAPPGVPKPILGTGTWKAGRVESFGLIGTYGALAAGIVEMEVRLIPEGGPVIAAMLEIVCNIGPAGLSTGEEEGFFLNIPGAPFGPFVPLMPALGLTIFTTGVEQRD